MWDKMLGQFSTVLAPLLRYTSRVAKQCFRQGCRTFVSCLGSASTTFVKDPDYVLFDVLFLFLLGSPTPPFRYPQK